MDTPYSASLKRHPQDSVRDSPDPHCLGKYASVNTCVSIAKMYLPVACKESPSLKM